jgi:hypothetical protein
MHWGERATMHPVVALKVNSLCGMPLHARIMLLHPETCCNRTFDDFLAALKQSKRKSIRQERRSMAKQNLRIQRLQGAQITPDIWDAFYDFYIDTTGTLVLCTHRLHNCDDDANWFVEIKHHQKMSVGEGGMQCVLVLSCICICVCCCQVGMLFHAPHTT